MIQRSRSYHYDGNYRYDPNNLDDYINKTQKNSQFKNKGMDINMKHYSVSHEEQEERSGIKFNTFSYNSNLEKKRQRQPKLGEANRIIPSSSSASSSASSSTTTYYKTDQSKSPRPKQTNIVLTENEIKKLDSLLTSSPHEHQKQNHRDNTSMDIKKWTPYSYIYLLAGISLVVTVGEALMRNR